MLPLAPVCSHWNFSPYSSPSAFAGNEMLISPEPLRAQGWISEAELQECAASPGDFCDLGTAAERKTALLARAGERFFASGGQTRAFEQFRAEQNDWLDDYALFRALADHFHTFQWTEWPADISRRQPAAVARWRDELAASVRARQFEQFIFFEQWRSLKKSANRGGVRIIGDIPFYVNLESADAWSRPEIFQIDPGTGRPAAVAGVPPDYFSATGQRWGNPLYRWQERGELHPPTMAWWTARIGHLLRLVDALRIDHFRGFDTFWAIPASEPTAVKGRWRPGPGAAFFAALEKKLGKLDLIAEDLGELTPGVEALRDSLGFPGMKILQFAFDGNPANPYLPHNYVNANCLVYTGTHDNNTSNGWFYGPETGEAAKRAILDYMNLGPARRVPLAIHPPGHAVGGPAGRHPRPGRPGLWRAVPHEHAGPGRGQLALAPDPRSADPGNRPAAAPSDRALQSPPRRLGSCPEFRCFFPFMSLKQDSFRSERTWQRKCYLSLEEVNMKKTMIAIASLLLLSSVCWSQDMDANANEVKYYDNAKVVRIKNVEGEGFVQRSYDEGNEEATANLPVFEKDTVGTTEGRLAVYLGRMNYLRLAGDTVVVLEKIPQLRKTDLNVRVEQGSIYLDIESLDQEKGIEIQTADCGIFLLSKGVYRVNANREGRTEVVVLEGIAEVAGREDSLNVRENQMIVMEQGEVNERPFYYSAADKDDFDRWNEVQNQELGYARFGTSRYLQSGYEDYEYEMSRAGRWTYMSDFNTYGWTPYYANSDWRPYANGRWVWNPYYGYVWTSYDTCGWFTHHYGRWNWSYNQGWCWIPSYHWSPAWVSWFWNDSYYGWSPLSWWNRPIVIVNNRWDRRYDYRRGMPRDSRSTIIIRKNELSAPNINRVALHRGAFGQNNEGTISYRGGAPTDRLAFNKVTVINAEGRSVIYKQGGIVSAEKYRAQGSDIHSNVYKYNQANTGEGVYRTRSAGGEGTYRARSTSGGTVAGGSTVYRSRSGEGTGSVSRSRDSSSGSSSERSSARTGYRSRTDGTARSSTSFFFIFFRQFQRHGQKEKGRQSPTSPIAAAEIPTPGKPLPRKAAIRAATLPPTAPSTAMPTRRRARSTAARSVVSGGNFAGGNSGDKSTRYSAPSYNYRSSRSGAYESGVGSSYRSTLPSSSTSREYRSNSTSRSYSPFAGGGSSYRSTLPSSSTSREYRGSSSSGSYSPSSGSRSSGSSGTYRSGASSSSGSSHGSSSSSSSSGSSRTAVKKK